MNYKIEIHFFVDALRMKLETFLEKTYHNPSNNAAFSSINKLYKAAKLRYPNVTINVIKDWLSSQDAYTLHKDVRRKFKRNKIIVHGIDEQWQVDLVDMNTLAKENKGYRYLLTCIDILSKFAWVVPLKSKTARNVIEVFEKIFKTGRIPIKLQSDGGREFNNTAFKQYMKKKGIHYFTTKNETKCSIVERFNRTLKTKMWKYFTFKNSHVYLNVLPKLVSSYNNTVHSSIKMKPKNADIFNQHIVLENLYGKPSHGMPTPTTELKVGDNVRISKMKHTFAKGYEGNWSYEIFTIIKVINRIPLVFIIKDFDGKEIEGVFYAKELQKVTKKDDSFWQIEKVLKTRKRNGTKEYFVKWLHHPHSMSSWVRDVKAI